MSESPRVELAEGVELWLGDCREILPRLRPADLVVTDPPYEVTPTSSHHYKPNGGMIKGGWMSETYPVGHGRMFECPPIASWARILFEACADNADCYVMINDRNLPEAARALDAAGWKHHNLLVWKKPTGIPNRWYFKNAEFTLYLFKGKAQTIAVPASCAVFECENKIAPGEREHNSQKPVKLMAHYIANSARPGATVLDPFMGSGSTGVAAVQLGRRFIGIEKDPAHFEIARARIRDALDRPDLFIAPRAPAAEQAALL
jgi:site-specific DNA-methyltransferase (adenine-specific)